MISDDPDTISSACRRCGPVEVPKESYSAARLRGQDVGVYRFTCPWCGQVASRYSNGRILRVLGFSGVEVIETNELPLTSDEIEAFAAALAVTSATEAVSELGAGDARLRFNASRRAKLRIEGFAEGESE